MGAPFGWAPSLLPDDGWAYADNPIGTSTTRPQQWMSNAAPIDPVATTVGGEPVTRGQMRDMARSAWQTAMSVSDGGLAAPGMMGAIRAYHGSPRTDLSVLKPSESGALGPGVYFSPAENVAQRYAGSSGKVYSATMPDNLFYGAGGRWDELGYGANANPYEIWRRQVASLVNAAPEGQRGAIQGAAARLSTGDGYPLYADVRRIMGSDAATTELFRKAGFQGITGFADGPEIALFGEQPLGIRAYHGSPHSFDRFDMSKIGTGEGAQAYGHGLYFAGNEGVARAYRDALSGANVDARNFMRDGQIVPDLGAVWQQSYDAAKGTRAMRPDDARAIAGHVRRWVEAGKKPETYLRFNVPPAGYEAAYEAAVQPWLGVSYKKNPGHMYEVSLNVEPRQLLDWDKPLAGQSAARNLPEAFQNTDEAAGAVLNRAFRNPIHGGDLAGAPTASPSDISAALADRGIPGLQYLDAGSRAAGEGSRNYVMFDPALIDIVRKYAVPGAIFGGAAAPFGFVGAEQ